MEFITSGDRIATENFSIGKIYTVTFTNGNYFINTCVGIGSDFVMFQQEAPRMLFCLDMESAETVSNIEESGGGSGTTNYNELNNKPSINGVTLIGNKTAADLSILPVPIVGENDNNKVLTASYSGGVGSYSWQPAPSSGTTDYTELTNKPQINSVELNGNKSLADLGIASAEALAEKQDTLNSSQLQAVNSGITSALVTQIGTNTSAIAGKQDALSSSQLQAVNSGITSADVAQITTNKNNILTANDLLAEIIDSGAKNRSTATGGSNVGGAGTIVPDTTISLPAGDYIFYWKNTATNVSTVINCYTSDNTRVVNENKANSAVESREINVPQDCVKFNLYCTGINTITELMICTKAAWNISQKYVPYCPTLAELANQ